MLKEAQRIQNSETLTDVVSRRPKFDTVIPTTPFVSRETSGGFTSLFPPDAIDTDIDIEAGAGSKLFLRNPTINSPALANTNDEKRNNAPSFIMFLGAPPNYQELLQSSNHMMAEGGEQSPLRPLLLGRK